MFENIASFFKKIFNKTEQKENSKVAAKERLQLVLMQDRANVSADFLDLMRQEIIEVIKKYITVDEKEIDVRLINKANEDGTNGAPALVANIPIVSVKNDNKKEIENNNNNNNNENLIVGGEESVATSSENKDKLNEEKKEENKEVENIQEKEVEEENKKEEAQA